MDYKKYFIVLFTNYVIIQVVRPNYSKIIVYYKML